MAEQILSSSRIAGVNRDMTIKMRLISKLSRQFILKKVDSEVKIEFLDENRRRVQQLVVRVKQGNFLINWSGNGPRETNKLSLFL